MTELNVTSLVDVMTTLLIIFILVAPMLKQGLPVDLPKTTEAEPIDQTKAAVVTIQKDGKLFLDGNRFTAEALTTVFEMRVMQNPDLNVLVEADGATAYSTVVEVFNNLRKAGVAKLGLVTEEEKKGTGR